MSNDNNNNQNRLLEACGVADNDYCKLAYYLQCVLVQCGIDNVIEPDLLTYDKAHAVKSQPDQDALVVLATGKQFGLSSLSYKTVFLMDNTTDIDTTTLGGQHISVEEATSSYHLQLDPLLLGGVVPVQPTFVWLCTTDWVRTFYAEPVQRLQGQGGAGQRLGSSSSSDDTTTPTTSISDDDVRALFVRTTSEEQEADAMDMASKLQQMVAAAKQRKQQQHGNAAAGQFQSFSGQGQSLGGSTSLATTSNSAEGGSSSDPSVFDPKTLKSPPAIDESAETTSIAVRLSNGKRHVVQLNVETSTVADLAAHITSDKKFQLVAGYPPKPLEDPTATIGAAGLKAAQVSVRSVSS